MSDAIEQLEQERDVRLSKIKGCQGHIVSLEDEISALQEQIKGLETAIDILQKDGHSTNSSAPAPVKLPTRPIYSKMRLTDAILDVIQKGGDSPGLFAQEIAEKLKSGGFTSKADSFYQSVYGVAFALMKKDRIREGKREGKRSFVRR
jgi:hypothetical protein